MTPGPFLSIMHRGDLIEPDPEIQNAMEEEAGRLPLEAWEDLTPEQLHRERMVCGVRVVDGIDATELENPLALNEQRDRLAYLILEGLLVNRGRPPEIDLKRMALAYGSRLRALSKTDS